MDKVLLAGGRYYAMAAHTEEHVAAYAAACNHAFGAIAKAVQSGEPGRWLRGKPASSGFKRLA